MKQVSYGLFEGVASARDAVAAIEASGTPRKQCGVVLHQNHLDRDDLGIAETGAREGLRESAAVNSVVGAAIGAAILGPLGLVGGGVLGALVGVIGGSLAGSGAPDRGLEKLSKQLAEGKVLVIVEAPDLASREAADAAMRSHGGHVEHKPFF
jgi:hypothetical protein